MEDLQHRLAAVWFADIVGYTRKSAEDEEGALRVVRSFQEAARDVTRRYEGRIVKFIGDAVLAEFASTEAAVRAALRLNAACVERARHAGVECPTLRIGVHVGDVATTADGDVYGDGVNLAARIVDEAAPGEVWVSQDVWRQLRQRPRFEFEARGAHAFEGFDAVDVYAVAGKAGVDVEGDRLSPAARARALVRDLRRHPAIPAAALVLSGAVVAWMLFGQERFAEGEPSGEEGAAAGVAPGDPSRVAVLYFDDRSEGDLADGLTEALIYDLSQVEELDVISREGVKRYRDVPLDSLVRALGAGTLVEGSVEQSGDLVRVTARLVDATDMTQLASIRVQQPRGELFALQDSLVADVLRGIQRQLGRDIRLDLARRATSSVEAWELV
jgi:adenylate cyclase